MNSVSSSGQFSKDADSTTSVWNGRMTEKESRKRMRNGTLTKSDKNLLKYNTDDRERNLEMALEKIAEEIKYGKDLPC